MRTSWLVFAGSILAGCAGGSAGAGQAAVAGPGSATPLAAPSRASPPAAPASPLAPSAPPASPAPSAAAAATATDADRAPTASGDAAAPAPVAPSGPALALADATALASQLAGLDTAGGASAWLSAAGFTNDDLSPLGAGAAISGSLETANLDADPELESIAMVVAKSAAEDGPRSESRYLVFIDRDAKGARIAGRKRIDIASCIADGGFALELQSVHAAAFSDAIIDTEQAPECDGNLRVTARRELWTLARGTPELLASNEDTTEVDRVSHRTIHEAAKLVFAGKPPKRAEVRAGQHVKLKLAFDAKAFRYR